MKEEGTVMFKRLLLVMALLCCALPAMAAPVSTYVAEFKITGAPGKDDLRQALQSLLASRLSGDSVRLVGANDAPELTVIGTYITFGKVFSLDARIVSNSGKLVGKAFEQGESADDVIPAVGRLADKLNGEIAKVTGVTPGAADASRTAAPKGGQPAPPMSVTPSHGAVDPQKAGSEGDIIRPEGLAKAGESGMIGQRLEGVIIGIAPLKGGAKGRRELVVALEKELRLYGQDSGLQLLGVEKSFHGNEKIIAVDVADLDGDGVEELYVTMLQGDALASRVFTIEKGKFRLIASDLPYFFRGMAAGDGERRIYAQQMGLGEDFYGEIYELVKKGTGFETANPAKLPRFGNIYNVNRLKLKDGRTLFVALHPDGYLTVYDEKGENIWKGSDKFGGSEAYFTREDAQNMRITGSRDRKVFLEQRLTVTRDGHIVVPKNEGTFVIGDSRSFNKNSMYAFAWNGAVLEELWRTKQSQNYLSDYLYDEDRKELVIVEVVKKAGIIDKGASAISVKRVE